MKKAYFLSDLHLGASYSSDNRELERAAASFLDSIKNDAEEIFLLGDILDYWFEYRNVVPRGYVRFFGKLAELADSGIKITWMIGNHDIWIFDYLPEELGIEVVDGVLEREISGVTFCLQHGDAIGGTTKFRIMRNFFRNRICQKLYSGIHPRWTVGFAHYCSRRSRLGKKMKKELIGEWPHNLIVDIRKWCVEQISEGNPARIFMFGHLHDLHDETLPDRRQLVVLPAFTHGGGYAVFDGKELKICYATYLPFFDRQNLV